MLESPDQQVLDSKYITWRFTPSERREKENKSMLSIYWHLLLDFKYILLSSLLLSSVNHAYHVQSLAENNQQNTGILWYKLTLVPLLPGEVFATGFRQCSICPQILIEMKF